MSKSGMEWVQCVECAKRFESRSSQQCAAELKHHLDSGACTGRRYGV